ncbi:FHA domain-containing protein [Paenibacillus spongiae]|uniref:FHA domain-containing protein n=1 Tax=Paenibacillus spongiae TaxID=2909671 RepID=A0ABY5SFZ5_9BACL|nr:FHA domain-containing protein [Paenibacillus spongiae]UVI31425.1 FHA domain-containing protein [Paenibacillus spongiae]
MSLVPLRIDFALNRGHELVVDRETGIARADLDEVELQMLQGQPIPKLLKVEWINMDGNIQFRYPLSGRRMLSHRLQMQPISMTEYYALLLAVVEALDDCKHYMLREDGFLLLDQTVFAGERLDDIALCYVPLRNTSHFGSGSPGDAVLALAIRWIGYVTQPDGNGMQSVFRHLREERVSWGSLRQTLLRQLSGPDRSGYEQTPVPPANAGVHPQQTRLESQERQRVNPITNEYAAAYHNELQPSSFASTIEDSGIRRQDKEELPLIELDIEEENKPAGRHSFITIAVYVIAVALIWRYLYLEAPSQTSLLISGGLTMLATAGAIAYWGKKRRRDSLDRVQSGSEQESSGYEEGFVPNSILLNARAATGREEARTRSSEVNTNPAAEECRSGGRFAAQVPERQQPDRSSHSFHQDNSASLPSIKPVETGHNQATVLLGQQSEHSDNGSPGGNEPWLEREMNGQLERVGLEEKRFIIGRSPEGTQYVDTSSGISRAHLELTAGEDCWTAKDIGSRNGSTLNGQTMIPYKGYRIASGDVLQLAGEKGPKYAFRMG